MFAKETGRQVNRAKKYGQAVKSALPDGAVGRSAAFKEWLKVCEAVKNKYRNESARNQAPARQDRSGRE
jgi:hypothetical protein